MNETVDITQGENTIICDLKDNGDLVKTIRCCCLRYQHHDNKHDRAAANNRRAQRPFPKDASRVNSAYAFPFAILSFFFETFILSFTSASEGHMLWYHENNLQVNLTREEEKNAKA
jgi:hypothetical protein